MDNYGMNGMRYSPIINQSSVFVALQANIFCIMANSYHSFNYRLTSRQMKSSQWRKEGEGNEGGGLERYHTQ
uniref:Uncharacterized protein n=1 Tax=Wuchereria bancrofti TaxID=6293 RepID=A0A1I8ESV5_WUCBA